MNTKLPMSKNRLEAYSDGVFAVALTLLILDLHVPNISEHSSIRQYTAALAPLIPKLISFVLTFTMICIYWVGHHYFFVRLHYVTVPLVWLNNLFLLWICFMPFPMSLLGTHYTDQFPILLYAVNQLLASINFFLFRVYASRQNLFVDENAAKEMGPCYSVPAILIILLSIILTFISIPLSLFCLVSVPVMYFFPNINIK